MQIAKSFLTDLPVLAQLELKEILTILAVHQSLSIKKLILAHQVLVVIMPSATERTVLPLVSVFKATLVIHSCHAGLSVLKALTVPPTRFAEIRNVWTPVQDCVASMLFAQSQTMCQDVTVFKVILEIHRSPVPKYQLHQLNQIHVIPILVDSTLISVNSTELVFALACQTTLEIHQTADLNVWSTQNVGKI